MPEPHDDAGVTIDKRMESLAADLLAREVLDRKPRNPRSRPR
jgi:hypothetical protein